MPLTFGRRMLLWCAVSGVLIALLLLGGCSTAQQAAAGAAVERARNYNDAKLKAVMLPLCSVSVGAYFRAAVNERRIIEAACGGEPMPRKSDRSLDK